MVYNPTGAQTYLLAASIGSTDTSILLSSFLEPISGVPYTMALINTDIVYATIAPRTAQSEFISFTGITQNANGTALLTGVIRGLKRSYDFTSNVTFKLPHAGQTQLILSNSPEQINEYASKRNDEDISGDWTFSVRSPFVPTEISSEIHRAASIEYVNNIAIAGAPNASTSVKGIVQEATQAQTDAKTATGSTGARLYLNPVTLRGSQYNDLVLDTGTANTYAIAPALPITSYIAGQVFAFKALHANTTTSTLNVSSLGTKTIKNSAGGNLVANDIIVGQIILVEYDGTNFQMINNSGNGEQILTSLSTDVAMGGGSPSDILYPSQKAVNTYVTNQLATLVLGTWASVAAGPTQVATDGFLVVYMAGSTGGIGTITVKTDSAATPTVIRAVASCQAFTSAFCCVTVPVKKNDYYSVAFVNQSATTVYFIPLGA